MLKRRPTRQEELYQLDDSIFRSPEDHSARLPHAVNSVFEEQQEFDQIWIWAILGIELLVTTILLLASGTPWMAILVSVSIMVASFALLSSLVLRTRIDAYGVHYRMKLFHRKERTIPWEDIDQIYVRKYSPIAEYGGWGIRYSLKRGSAFNVRGRYGIQIVKKNGKRILLGTQDPEGAAQHLSEHPLTV